MQILAALTLTVLMQADGVDWLKCPDEAISRGRRTGTPVLLYLWDS